MMRVAIKALFSKTERFLIKNNRKFVIGSVEKESVYRNKLDENIEDIEDTILNRRRDWLLEETGILLKQEKESFTLIKER